MLSVMAKWYASVLVILLDREPEPRSGEDYLHVGVEQGFGCDQTLANPQQKHLGMAAAWTLPGRRSLRVGTPWVTAKVLEETHVHGETSNASVCFVLFGVFPSWCVSCNPSNFVVFSVFCAGPSNAAQFLVSLTTAPRCQAHGGAVITGETVGFPMGMRALLGNGGKSAVARNMRTEVKCAADVVPIGTTILKRSRAGTNFKRKSTRTSTSDGREMNSDKASYARVVEEGASKLRERWGTSFMKPRENQAETIRAGKEDGNAVQALVLKKSSRLQKYETFLRLRSKTQTKRDGSCRDRSKVR